MIIDQKTDIYANYYNKLKIDKTSSLVFRDLHHVINKFQLANKKFLDYGCGCGDSTNVLKNFTTDIIGVDINRQMIKNAKTNDPNGEYIHIDTGILPFEDDIFSCVFSSWVLVEVSTLNEMQKLLKEIYRVLHRSGIYITAVCNKNTYSKKWLSLNTNFEENNELISGEIVKVHFPDIDLTILDYYWSDDDYKSVFNNAGFKLIDIYHPLGKESDNVQWIDEIKYPSSTIYVSQK